MKNSKLLKRLLSLLIIIAMLMSVMSFSVFAADTENKTVPADETTVTDKEKSEEAEPEEEPDPFAWLFEIFGELRMITLTDEAKAIALKDFDYLSKTILEISPVQNVIARHLGISMKELLGIYRQFINTKFSIPSLTFLALGDDWLEEPEEQTDLDLAADYLMSLIILLSNTIGGLGHIGPIDDLMYNQQFTVLALAAEEIAAIFEEFTEEELKELVEAGALGDIDFNTVMGNIKFKLIQYDILNNPAALKLYEVDPEDLDPSDAAGPMDEENLTMIAEDGIAYLHIKSFYNSLEMDFNKLIPFFAEIQDYDHLIIDIRGNGGGFAGYFPFMLELLIDEPLTFQYPEFYIDSKLTAGYYEYPASMLGGNLVGIYKSKDFVKEQKMTQFNKDDLKLLDKVLLWETEFLPMAELSDDVAPFNGEIWLLVDGGCASASVVAAMICANTGFATVVGEPTTGVTGVIYTYTVLPNTGIVVRTDLGYVTDDFGRSYEEFGVIPQIPNMPELDALATVMTLIAAPTDVELKTQINLDGEDTGVKGVIFEGTTLVPVESVCDIFEDAELTVDDWQVTLSYGDIEAVFNINSKEVWVNDVSFEMLQPLQIINGEIFVPIRFVAETLGYDVDFIDKIVVIESNY